MDSDPYLCGHPEGCDQEPDPSPFIARQLSFAAGLASPETPVREPIDIKFASYGSFCEPWTVDRKPFDHEPFNFHP